MLLSTNIMLPVHFILVPQGTVSKIPARTPVLVDEGLLILCWLPEDNYINFDYVDQSAEAGPGVANTDGAVLHHVEAHCSNIPYPTYGSQKELTCVVCSK